MIPKEFVEYIAGTKGIVQKDLIEKDLLLQQILAQLQRDPYFHDNFVFKGGTCLVKCHLDYYRFSEDLDFSWINQNVFKGKSEKQIRKILSKEIDAILSLLQKFTPMLGLDFKSDKTNKKYVEHGCSNKFVTFKLWYNSLITERESFIKLQFNFVELFKYPFHLCAAKTLTELPKELEFLFPDQAVLFKQPIKLQVYDLREILLEKSRAVLTRQDIKARDFIDLYFITEYLNTKLEHYKHEIIEKTAFMLKYEKYLKNMIKKEEILNTFILPEIEHLLLKSTTKEITEFVTTATKFFSEILTELKQIVQR